MATVKLFEVAISRSGDKGDGSNVGIRANSPAIYEFLEEHLTADRVKQHFHKICLGEVERYELPNLQSLNFILHDSLGGGGTETIPNVGTFDRCTMDGWYYEGDDPMNPERIVLCPNTCRRLESDVEGRVDIALGCATLLI